MIPHTFEAWKNCITNDCKIDLTKEFAARRLKVYQNPSSPETKTFVKLYGQQHLENVIRWLKMV
ncbi:MAG: hypothetical protein KI786_17835 [Mameliella sp.]|nr:hypothetical protein [Phaeodactylibacter sp.]